MTFSFCKIDNDYIKELNAIDSRVQYHHGQYDKPYLGILLTINNMDYFVPLSSRKPKHYHFEERLEFIKIENKKGLYAVIYLNNMIPVPKSCVINFNFNNLKDKKYANLLRIEFGICKSKQEKIIKSANILYKNMTIYPEKHPELTPNCVDFKKLEAYCQSYFEKNQKKLNKFEERLLEAEKNNSNRYDAIEQKQSRKR